jgi:hypothetical protein
MKAKLHFLSKLPLFYFFPLELYSAEKLTLFCAQVHIILDFSAMLEALFQLLCPGKFYA